MERAYKSRNESSRAARTASDQQRLSWTLAELLLARRYAEDACRSRWDFAVEIDLLRSMGANQNDFRFLSCMKYVEHAVEVTRSVEVHAKVLGGNRKAPAVVVARAGLAEVSMKWQADVDRVRRILDELATPALGTLLEAGLGTYLALGGVNAIPAVAVSVVFTGASEGPFSQAPLLDNLGINLQNIRGTIRILPGDHLLEGDLQRNRIRGIHIRLGIRDRR